MKKNRKEEWVKIERKNGKKIERQNKKQKGMMKKYIMEKRWKKDGRKMERK